MASAHLNHQVAQLYVALLGRAPDAEGMAFWAGLLAGGRSLAEVADAMFAVEPVRALYPAGLSNQQIISAFYVNAMGRAADADGLAFWTARLDAEGATPGSVIAQMMHVAAHYDGSDPAGLMSASFFGNRTAAAQFYGEHGGSIAHADTVLAEVTSLAATVVAARTLVVASGASGAIDAGGFSEVSIGRLTGDLDLAVRAGTGIHVRESTSEVTLLPDGVVGPLWTVNYALPDATGSNDALDITLASDANMAAGFFDIEGIEHLTVSSVNTGALAHYHSLYLGHASLETLILRGDVLTSVPGEIGLASFDASALAGGTYFIAPARPGEIVSLVGSAGNDYLDSASEGDYRISGGAGDDTLRGGPDDVLTGGDGADEFWLRAGTDRTEYVSIVDFTLASATQAGDRIDTELLGLREWQSEQLVLPEGASFDAYLDAAAARTGIQSSGEPSLGRWFQFGSHTYIVADRGDQAVFEDGTDVVIKLVGLLDLSALSLDLAQGHLHSTWPPA